LTLADEASNEVIVRVLKTYTPDVPVLSEEGLDIPFAERQAWEYFWYVDPLDGTKEFVKKNGEFTVNIALIHNQTPILGVIYVPVTNIMYYASVERGAWKIDSQGAKTILAVSKKVWGVLPLKVAHTVRRKRKRYFRNTPVIKRFRLEVRLNFVCWPKVWLRYISGKGQPWNGAPLPATQFSP